MINRLQHWQKVGRGGMIKSRNALMRVNYFRIVTLAQCSNFDLASQKQINNQQILPARILHQLELSTRNRG